MSELYDSVTELKVIINQFEIKLRANELSTDQVLTYVRLINRRICAIQKHHSYTDDRTLQIFILQVQIVFNMIGHSVAA